jgi:tetratricopeptide (TPR) repeat protein
MRIIFFLCLLHCTYQFKARAYNAPVPAPSSLKSVMVTDSLLSRQFYDLAKEKVNSYPDSAIYYLQRALKASSEKWQILHSDILSSLGENYMNLGSYDSARFYTNKLTVFSLKKDLKKTVFSSYIQSGNIEFYQGYYQKAESYFSQALGIAKP